MPSSRRRWRIVALALCVATSLSGCASPNTPASERGFFGGVGAMVSGNDERRAASLERSASEAEQRKQQLQARLDAANADAARTGQQVQAAERRLTTIKADLQRQRERLAAMRTGSSSSPSATEAARLQNEAEAIERERRAAQEAGTAVTPATLQNLEQRTRALGNAIDRLGAV